MNPNQPETYSAGPGTTPAPGSRTESMLRLHQEITNDTSMDPGKKKVLLAQVIQQLTEAVRQGQPQSPPPQGPQQFQGPTDADMRQEDQYGMGYPVPVPPRYQ